jgi:hypothetical protein
MNRLKPCLLSLLFLTCPLWGADAPPSFSQSRPDSDPITEALPVLQLRDPDFPSLAYKPGDRLSDLITRSDGGLSLVAGDSPPSSINTVTLPDGTPYWRLASFTPKNSWADLANELKSDERRPSTGIILDLRSNDSPQDMKGASQIMAFFLPGDATLDRPNVRDTDRNQLLSANLTLDTPFRGPLVVLIDQRTSGAAEVLAACMKADGALLIGTPTAGKGADFGELKLSTGQTLRFVADHVHAPPHGGDLWGRPVVPDITVAVDDHAEKAALMLIRDDHIADVIQESDQRHRMGRLPGHAREKERPFSPVPASYSRSGPDHRPGQPQGNSGLAGYLCASGYGRNAAGINLDPVKKSSLAHLS